MISISNLLDLDLRSSPVPMSPSLRGPFTHTEIFLLLIYVVVFLIGTVGNGLVIKAFYGNQEQPGSRFVLALAFIDFITSMGIPIQVIGNIVNKISDSVYSWPFGKVMCYLSPFWTLSMASAWLLLAICLERIR